MTYRYFDVMMNAIEKYGKDEGIIGFIKWGQTILRDDE